LNTKKANIISMIAIIAPLYRNLHTTIKKIKTNFRIVQKPKAPKNQFEFLTRLIVTFSTRMILKRQ